MPLWFILTRLDEALSDFRSLVARKSHEPLLSRTFESNHLHLARDISHRASRGVAPTQKTQPHLSPFDARSNSKYTLSLSLSLSVSRLLRLSFSLRLDEIRICVWKRVAGFTSRKYVHYESRSCWNDERSLKGVWTSWRNFEFLFLEKKRKEKKEMRFHVTQQVKRMVGILTKSQWKYFFTTGSTIVSKSSVYTG